MKLNKSNNVVHFLVDGEPIRFESLLGDEVGRLVKNVFPLMRPLFRKKIQYLTKPFFEAFVKGGELIGNALREESIKQSGTLILPIPEKITLTIFYDVNYKGPLGANKSNLNGFMMAFLQKKDFPEPRLFFYNEIDNNLLTGFFGDNEIDEEKQVAWYIGLIIFQKFCEVETKVVPPGKKSSYRFENYVNDTALPVEILDSTWFTTIVRSDAFTVGGKDGGFFRWQRCGPGLSEKKLVWVPAFEKKGYVRKAKILAQDAKK